MATYKAVDCSQRSVSWRPVPFFIYSRGAFTESLVLMPTVAARSEPSHKQDTDVQVFFFFTFAVNSRVAGVVCVFVFSSSLEQFLQPCLRGGNGGGC